MGAFGSLARPVRTSEDISVNSPDGFMSEPPGGLWWEGLHSTWESNIPPSVTRATSIVVNPLCRMPWNVIDPDGRVTAPAAPGYPAWLADPMLLNGSTGGPHSGGLHMLDRVDRFDLWGRWLRHALWLGRGLLAFRPDSSGQPLAGSVQVIAPGRLRRSDDAGWTLDVGGVQEPVADDGSVAGHRLVVLRHSLPAGVFGRHRESVAFASRITRYASETLDSDVPTGVLTTDMPVSQTQADKAREEWHARQARRQVAVLGNGLKYMQSMISPVDAELAAMALLSGAEVAHMFELPAWMLDAGQNTMTYSNSRDWRQDLVDGPLASWSARVEETLSALLPWGWRIAIDFTAYTTVTTSAVEGGGSGVSAVGPAGE